MVLHTKSAQVTQWSKHFSFSTFIYAVLLINENLTVNIVRFISTNRYILIYLLYVPALDEIAAKT